jgi:hypothetical protein
MRIPRGYAKTNYPYHEQQEGKRPSFPNLQPAAFLPVAAIDELHHDPIVLPPGTFVGRLPIAESWDASFRPASRPLAPACPNTYTVTYGANDLDTAGLWGGTPDLDNDIDTVRTAATASSDTVGPIKPVGVISQPVYASWTSTRWTNYQRNLDVITFLNNGAIITIPAMTTREHAIEPGDLVCIDHTGSTWDPTDPQNNFVGRLQRYSAVVASLVDGASESTIELAAGASEYVIGRCVQKHLLISQTATSSAQSLRAAVAAGNVTISTLNTDYAYTSLRKVQTVPGLELPGSGTEGIPGYFGWAYPDSGDDYWALDIVVRV